MAPKRSKVTRQPRGAQKWVLAELRALKPGDRLSTSQVAKRIRKASQRSFHKNSVYNALRILVGRGSIEAERDGHEKLYRALGSQSAREQPSSEARAARVASPSPSQSPALDSLAAQLPHKLALGEILVISIGNGAVVTATNLHGQLVLERHPLPS